MINKNKIGVIISRFQTPNLHFGHTTLLNKAVYNSEIVVVFLGSHPIPSTKRNPMDFQTRKLMVEEYFQSIRFGNFHIFEIKDHPSDVEWSKKIDSVLSSLYSDKNVTLYDGRDGFSQYYFGTNKVEMVTVSGDKVLSATDERRKVKPLFTEDFRRGMIYSANIAYHKISAATDIACWRELDDSIYILLGEKRHSPGVKRFPGGMVDLNDNSYKEAAQRELHEETDILVSKENIEYIDDFKIHDWRACDSNKYFTTFYAAKYENGAPKSKDDLVNVEWFDIKFLNNNQEILATEHQKLYNAFITWITKQKKI